MNDKKVPQIAQRRARLAAQGRDAMAKSKAPTAAAHEIDCKPADLQVPQASDIAIGYSAIPLSPTKQIEHLLGTLYHARKRLGELRTEEARPRVTSSEACKSLLDFVKSVPDPMLLCGAARMSVTSDILGKDQGCCTIA